MVRIDDRQVKISGYRIELEEIENRIATLETIESCHVQLLNKALVVYVAIREKLSKERLTKTINEVTIASSENTLTNEEIVSP